MTVIEKNKKKREWGVINNQYGITFIFCTMTNKRKIS
jgi:hypothetical protein